MLEPLCLGTPSSCCCAYAQHVCTWRADSVKQEHEELVHTKLKNPTMSAYGKQVVVLCKTCKVQVTASHDNTTSLCKLSFTVHFVSLMLQSLNLTTNAVTRSLFASSLNISLGPWVRKAQWPLLLSFSLTLMSTSLVEQDTSQQHSKVSSKSS